MTIPATLPRFELLDAPRLVRQVEQFGLSTAGVERLVAIDRVLRSLVKAGLAGRDASAGWALAGPSALHGVYLRSKVLLRVPDELGFAPVASGPAIDAPAFAALIATALPDGIASTDETDSARYLISYTGGSGPAMLPLRLERSPLRLDPPLGASLATHAGNGYLYDARLPYLSRVALSPISVPVAFAEEIILRVCIALLASGRGDNAERVDDLRLALALEGADTRAALAGPIRDTFVAGFQAKGAVTGADLRAKLEALSGVIASLVERHSDPSALPPDLRPTLEAYDSNGRRAFEIMAHDALAGLVHGDQR